MWWRVDWLCRWWAAHHGEEAPTLGVVLVVLGALEEHEVGELLPVDGAICIGVDFHEELRDLLLGEVLAEVRAELLAELFDVELAGAVVVRILRAGRTRRVNVSQEVLQQERARDVLPAAFEARTSKACLKSLSCSRPSSSSMPAGLPSRRCKLAGTSSRKPRLGLLRRQNTA